jgi:hypothetical protein
VVAMSRRLPAPSRAGSDAGSGSPAVDPELVLAAEAA